MEKILQMQKTDPPSSKQNKLPTDEDSKILNSSLEFSWANSSLEFSWTIPSFIAQHVIKLGSTIHATTRVRRIFSKLP